MIRGYLKYCLIGQLLVAGLLAMVLILTSLGCVTTITVQTPTPTPTRTPTPTSTPTSTLTPTPTYAPPTKLLPAYALDIQYPTEKSSVEVERGGSVTLPVTVRSLVDEPIKIRLNLTAATATGVAEFVQFETEKEYRTLNPGDTIDTEMTITVSQNAPLGSFFLGITCELYEPVEERAHLAMIFTFTVTGS